MVCFLCCFLVTRQKVTIGTAWPTEPKKINLWPFTENIYLTLLQYLPCSVTIRIECYIKCLVRGIRVRKPWAYAASENEYGAVCEDLSRTEKKDKLGNNLNILSLPSIYKNECWCQKIFVEKWKCPYFVILV